MFIIVGLGNPGREYAKTRHNVGFMTADVIADKLGISFNHSNFKSVYGDCKFANEKVILAKPETFMNNSGFAVVQLLQWFKVPTENLIVIYDDIDLPCGALRIKSNGSAGTHNGMRSISQQLGSDDFIRIRIGIGKPKHDLINFVLGEPDNDDMQKLQSAFSDAASAVELILQNRLSEAQNKYNYKPPKHPKNTSGTRSDYSPAVCLTSQSLRQTLENARELMFANLQLDSSILDVARSFSYNIDGTEEALNLFKKSKKYISMLFPDANDGEIVSPLTVTNELKKLLPPDKRPANLLIKQDNELPIAGSIKARGGIYTVLKYTWNIAKDNGIIDDSMSYDVCAEKLFNSKDFFRKHSIHVGSTGNLALSIGIMSAKIGYNVTVHMSNDAKQWKKDLLRSRGCNVIEYDSDYNTAVANGRRMAAMQPNSYFIDDERSFDLFYGYSTAAYELASQLKALNIMVDEAHPLFVYLPCGVGGAPAGITYGLKQIYKDSVHCFFIEPVNAPCMHAAFAASKCINVNELGLSGKTQADGLAVGRASELAFDSLRSLSDGGFTVSDHRLFHYQKSINALEGIYVEPSAAIGLAAILGMSSAGGTDYFEQYYPNVDFSSITEIMWATGGSLVPDKEKFKRH